MRELVTAPDAILDPITGAARVGSYRGELPRVDLSPLALRGLDRLLKHKRWTYVAIASDEVFIAVAVVHLGYLAITFGVAFDKAGRRLLVDRSTFCPPFAASVGDAGGSARAWLPPAQVRIERPRGEARAAVTAALRGLELEARLSARAAPQALSAVAEAPGGVLIATEKRLLLGVEGEASVLGRRISLDGALASYDYTSGLLPRRTTWRWALALGRAESGERVGLNVGEGFIGDAECAIWLDGELIPLAEGRFTFDAARPLDPWRVRTVDGAVDLRFVPGAAHSNHTNLGLVASEFMQPIGLYSGTIRLPEGRHLELRDVLGVTEDQDITW
ncbi:DUF2804 domain-containing protein [Sorangium cellulosum]|uniref:DUF2804 domain-containing protein n=2 Tax=Sorangium cellulosum TaxID=56 RepID=A0A150TF37_SORCE|nr:DUF2804 domain-containing protein [Sorangium cellulosum]AGP37843.1 hypothetical protein SCE1572_27225 [Sorangium cellulosum So0157-2]KYG03315.1 hypothetical protein BE21_52285 [Sorangium cellulosum]